jgi:hypothetical protein
MLELRHMVPEVARAQRVAVVDLSPGRIAGEDTADKVRFWSPEAHVEVMAPDGPANGDWDLLIIVHDGLMYRRGRQLMRLVKAQLANTPFVATFDLRFQRAWRVDRNGYGAFSRRAWVYPFLLAAVRRLPVPLRRPLLGTR